ncbi:MAG: DDE-type integrase/transposase/recombinase [Rubrobacteraceae bacterium]
MREGFLYLAFILDTHSRRIVGWSIDSHMRTELVVDALEMAVWRRKPSAGRVHHSDLGGSVEGDLVRQAPRRGRHRPLDGKDRECPGQSAMAESFTATLKTELVHRRRFPS